MSVHKVKELNKKYQKTIIFDIIDGLKYMLYEYFIIKVDTNDNIQLLKSKKTI